MFTKLGWKIGHDKKMSSINSKVIYLKVRVTATFNVKMVFDQLIV